MIFGFSVYEYRIRMSVGTYVKSKLYKYFKGCEAIVAITRGTVNSCSHCRKYCSNQEASQVYESRYHSAALPVPLGPACERSDADVVL